MMKRTMQLFTLLVLLLVLPACLVFGSGPATPTPLLPTLPPEPTQPQPTQPEPTQPLPSPTVPDQPTSPPAPTATAPGSLPPEAVAILQPAPGSRVVSPVRVSGAADPTFEQSLVVTILLADGTIIAIQPAQINAELGQRGPYSADVPFNIAQEQQGFIQVYATSARDGGVTHLASVGVTLAPGGDASIMTREEQPEQIVIMQPAGAQVISGGVARVEGFGLASFEQTLVVELLDESGQTLASVPVTVEAPDLGQPGPFSAELRYQIQAAMPGRVVVRDISPAHGGDSHRSSVEVRLEP